MRRQSLYPLVSVLILVAACGGGGSSPTQPADLSSFQVESQSFNLINSARSAEQISMLALDPLLSEVARQHSEAMRDRGFFSHVDPDGETLRDRLRLGGVTFEVAGENLAQVEGSSDPAGQAHQLLMESKSHRDNILGTDYELVGVGVAKLGSTYWITQVFLTP
jgi:uncharacterized protein YkwD